MSLKGTVWAPIGPSPIAEGGLRANGLTTAIAINPNNSNVMYQGTAGGGVWRTVDGGVNWTPLFDRQLALGIGEPGALAIDPNNTNSLYAGTSPRVMLGGAGFGPFAPRPSTAGLFKSTDAGASWIQLGSGYPAGNSGNAIQFVNQWINVIIVDPANSNILYLGSSSGVFRSVDGGQNWTLGTNGSGDARSLVLDTSSPATPRILYAGISGRGVFQSTDGGQNWRLILSGATGVVASAIGLAPSSFNKVVVAIAPPAAAPNAAGVQVLYVSLEGTPQTGGPPDPVGLFLSKDQGVSWTKRPATAMPTGTQRGYSFHMAVDPASPGDGSNDRIYFGTVGLAVSTDSGGSFTGLPTSPPTGSNGLHADTHAWAFFPQPAPTPSIVYCGNDGGLYKSVDNGANWAPLNAGGLQTGLFYNIDVKPDDPAGVTVGTLQDNQVQTTVGGSGLGWVATAGGDGFDVAYDGTIPKRVYSTSGCGVGVNRSNDDGVTWTGIAPPWTGAEAGGGNNCYMPPITTDPGNGGTVYVSGNQNLWQSTDGGGTWRILRAFGGTGNVNVARTNGNNVVIAVGTQVFVSTNARASTVTFTNISAGLPSRNVIRAVFDPNDPTVIYAVLGGFNGAGQTGHVFRTSIGAASWTDISPTAGVLAEAVDLPFNAIALDGADTPTGIYVGTDFGVLRSVDGGSSWSVLDDIHFPRVPVTDLILNQAAGVLRAATYGRGVFDFIKPVDAAIAVDPQNGLAFGTVCSAPASLTLEIFNVGAKDLTVYSVQRLMGSTSFSVLGMPGTPVTIQPGDHLDFTVQYAPAAPGPADTATIRIRSNDPAAPVVDLTATGQRGAPTLTTAIADSGNIGTACLGSFAEEELTINNTGFCPLSISNISSSLAEFLPPAVIFYPLVVSPGGSIDVVIRFQPTSFGRKSAAITLTSDDPAGDQIVNVSGVAPAPRLDPLIANSGNFGNVCVGSFADEPLILSNSGRCALSISNIASSQSEFMVPRVGAFPLVIAAGGSLEVPIRFQPASFGLKTATLMITSDDPGGQQTVDISGNAPSGKLAVTGSTSFGGVTACCCADRTISICNTGDCSLHVTSVRLKRKSHHWKLLHNPFPATLRAGSCLSVVIRYKATEKCPRCCELIIESDDPNTPVKTLEVLAYTIWEPCACKDCCEDCRRGACDKRHQDSCCRQGYPCCGGDDEDQDDD